MGAHKTQRMASAFVDFLERCHKPVMIFSITLYEQQLMKRRFHLWILKPKSSKSSGCTQIYQTNRKSLNKCCLPESWWQLFSGTGKSANDEIHATMAHNGVTSVLQSSKTKLHRTSQYNRSGMLTYGVVPLHENVRQHKAARTRALLEHFNLELFDHLPYSLDLAPSD
jgi:hypothetical protein